MRSGVKKDSTMMLLEKRDTLMGSRGNSNNCLDIFLFMVVICFLSVLCPLLYFNICNKYVPYQQAAS
jgi:hypothetical protein